MSKPIVPQRAAAAAPPGVPVRPLLRGLGLLLMLGLAALLVVFGIDLWHRIAGLGDGGPTEKQQIALLQVELTKMTIERDQLAAAAPPSAAALTPAAPTPVAPTPAAAKIAGRIQNPPEGQTQIKALQLENSKLSTDLLLAESLIPPEKAGAGLAIRAMRAEMLAPGQLHYVVLLAHGAKKTEPHFTGQMQLAVMVLQDGVNRVMEFPGEKTADAPLYDVKVERYQRLDGMLTLPAGAVAKAVKIRFADNGKLVAQQSSSVTEVADVRP